MSEITISCTIEKTEQHVAVLSPGVGRASVRVAMGQIITGGQVIADFWRLNQHFLLCAPDQCRGLVSKIKDGDRSINLVYHEPFLFLSGEKSESAPLAKIHDHPDGRAIKSGKSIDAPMDGMFYLSASPDSPPFVKLGDEVCKGQTLGLIEVMKSFFPVKYQGEKTAKITGVSIKNATPVNCGTQIFKISD